MPRNRTSPVETVDIGDLVAFTWKDGAVTRSAYGRIERIDYHGRTRILRAADGAEIARYTLDAPSRVQAVVVERYRPVAPSLFGMNSDGSYDGMSLELSDEILKRTFL